MQDRHNTLLSDLLLSSVPSKVIDEVTKQRLEFLKQEQSQLFSHNEHLEQIEWQTRSLSVTLWLASVAVGMGLQGPNPNLIILSASAFVPFVFLYLDSRLFSWVSAHKARRKQIELFLSDKNYIVPSTGKEINFDDFCTNPTKTFDFPLLDFSGKRTMGDDLKYILNTRATFPHMTTGLRRYFYHMQMIASLFLIALELYNRNGYLAFFLLVLISPALHYTLKWFAKLREQRITRKINKKKQLQQTFDH